MRIVVWIASARTRAWRIAAIVILLMGVSSPALATEQAAAILVAGSPIYDGIRGNMGIRTDPATVVNVGYVHPVQADVGASFGDFVAIGTANGNGVTGTACLDDYDAKWTVYSDGILGGVYFCADHKQDAYTAGSNPSFSIVYGWCPSQSANRWLLSLGGVLWTCKNSASTGAQRVGGGLETTGTSTVDRDIDVKYTNMEKNLTGSSSWSDFGNAGGAAFADPNYTYQFVNNRAFNTFLAPLA